MVLVKDNMAANTTKVGNAPAVTAAFRVLQGPLRGRKFRFETNLITIGRNEDANICIADDRAVSRIHAEVHLVDGHYVLRNRSNSGTFVNDKLLLDEKQLESKDRIRIGDQHLLEFIETSGSAASRKGLGSNKLIIGGAVYMLLLAGLAIFLSRSNPAGKASADAQEIQQVVDRYAQYANTQQLPKEEQDARVRAAAAYLRAGLIAERQGQYDQARQIYLRLLEFAPENDSPVHKYAVAQLRSVPVTR